MIDTEVLILVKNSAQQELHTARRAIEILSNEEAERQDCKSAYQIIDTVRRHTQGYYIRYHTRGPITAAARALLPQVRVFLSHWLLVDEASQLTESATVAVMSRCFPSLRKVVLFGDPNRIRPFGFKKLTELQHGSFGHSRRI